MSELEIKQAIRTLKSHHYKYTDKRSAMLIYFIQANRYVSAKDIHIFMRGKFQSISYDTVFRNLQVFEEAKIIESIKKNDEMVYRFSKVTYKMQQQRFICTSCGAAEIVQMCDTQFFEDQLPGYLLEGHRLELYGKCARCLNQKK